MIEKTIHIEDVVVRINSSNDIYIFSDITDHDLFHGFNKGDVEELTKDYKERFARPTHRWNEYLLFSYNKHRRKDE
jgi:hypothetical protein